MMLGTLFTPTGSCLRVYSDRQMHFTPKSSFKPKISAAAAQAIPTAVETTRIPSNLYQVLKVNRDASQSEIKSAYRTLAKIYHPDVAAGAAAKHPEESFDGRDFIGIYNAYSTLSDPGARAIYDLTLSIGSRQRRPLTGDYSYAGSHGERRGFYTTRRWETDQCW